MNISELTLARLNKEEEKVKSEEKVDFVEEPIVNVKDFFNERLINIDQIQLSSDERYEKFIKENMQVDVQVNTQGRYEEEDLPKRLAVYGTIDLSNVFRRCSEQMSDEQRLAFGGIENVRSFLDASSCSCTSKKAKLEEYYNSFVKGNSETDLFYTIKEKLKLEKITFFYESQILLEI